MLNLFTIKTISDLRSNPLAVMKTVQKEDEPVYIFYRTKPQAAIVKIEDLHNLIDEIQDLKDALEVVKRQKDSKRKLVRWETVKKELNIK